MNTHKKDLERHPALSGGATPRFHEVVIAAEGTHGQRTTVFVDGRELLIPEGGELSADWSEGSFPVVTVSIWAETAEVISWDEMEKRSH